jgi:hypothetical protein
MMNQTTTGRWLRRNGAVIVFLDPASAQRTEVDSESALKAAWAKQAIRRVHRGSNAYKEDQLPNRYGVDGLVLNPEREEEEFRAVDLPNKVKEAFARGPLAWPAVVQRAIEAGIRDSAKLASIVFFLHHSERDGRALDSNEPNFKKLSEEWKAWRTLIEPILTRTLGASAPSTPGSGIESPGGGRIKDKREPRREDLITVRGYKGRKVLLHRRAAQALEAMIQTARADGIPQPLLTLVSGYRSVARQEKLWKIGLGKHGSAQEARKWIAPPGSSAHHSGRAVDLWMGRGIGKRYAEAIRREIAYQWMSRNAARFGFYPYEREPWHWEYNPPAAG